MQKEKDICVYGDCQRKIWLKNPLASIKHLCNEHYSRYEHPRETTVNKLIETGKLKVKQLK